MDQGSRIAIFDHPQRAIGSFFHIPDAVPHVPTLNALRSAVAVKDNAVEALGLQAAHEAAAIPLREALRAPVEHQIARRNHRSQ